VSVWIGFDDPHQARTTRCAFFVNVDPRVADDPAFSPGFTHELVRRHGLAPDQFVLELTEIMETPESIEHMRTHYASQGFRVAIDDLGTGERSLAICSAYGRTSSSSTDR